MKVSSVAGCQHCGMVDIAEMITRRGGLAHKQQLMHGGATDQHLTAAVRSGEVRRARNGWYSTWADDDARFRAVRVGGRLTGISAVRAMGGWVLGEHVLHVSLPRNASRLRSQWNRRRRLNPRVDADVNLHWDSHETTDRGSTSVAALNDVLRIVILQEPFETAVAALDWATHTGHLDESDLETVILTLPADLQGIRDWVDPRCESLPESLARTRLRLAGHSVVSQVPLNDNQRIDLVVDDAAAVEVDGDEFHRLTFEQDRRKDVDITMMNLHAMRPSARMVFNDWDHFAAAIEIAIAARRPRLGNSGSARSDPLRARGMTGWRRRSLGSIPEFPKEQGRRRE